MSDAIRYGRRMMTTCESCGQEINATIGGSLPVGATLDAGRCSWAANVGRYVHQPTVQWLGVRIR
jgi:hypothetical protein